jgi:hypothetical protein
MLIFLCKARAATLISANNASSENGPGPIQTFDFTTGRQINSFMPDDTASAGANGRAVAIQGSEFFYTELTDGFGPSDGIHVAPYGTDGYGGHDTRVLPNPTPTTGVQGLAFHNGELFALTGYDAAPLEVFELDPVTGSVISGPISIGTPAQSDSDGFIVLTNGNFLINDGDASPVYREYSGTTGNLVSGGLLIDLTTFGFFGGTGACLAPDGQSYYFCANFNTLVQLDLTGQHLLASVPVSSSAIEEIAAVETSSCDVYARDGSVTNGGSTFTFNVIGPAGSFWNVYSSSDLTNWTLIGGTSPDIGTFSDNTISGVPYRFYKLSDGECCSQAIGFTRIQVGAGTTNSPGTNALIANQLDAADGNTLDGLFNVNGSGDMPDGTPLPGGSVLFKYDFPTQAYVYYFWTGAGWLDGNGNNAGTVSLNPGEGAFLAVSNATQVTFVGLVREGSFSIPTTPGQFQLVSSEIPKTGGLQTGLGFTPNRKDIIETWNGSGFNSYQFVGSPGQWSPSEPVIKVGQSFFWKSTTNSTPWQMSFSACSGPTVCSPPTVSNAAITNGTFSFNAVGVAGSTWGVYESSDLTNWTQIGGLTLDGGIDPFKDSTITGVPYRFYKLSDGTCCSQAIGFTTIQVGAGTTNSPGTNALIANQLDAPSDTLDGLFNLNGKMPGGTALPGGSVLFKYNIPTQAYVYYFWTGSGWLDGNGNNAGGVSLNPGEGAFLAVSNATQVTFVGLVQEGSFSIPTTPGQFQLVSSEIPKTGGLQTGLGFTPNRRDIIETWNGSGFNSYQFVGSPGQWSPSEPVIKVGQSFFWKSTTNSTPWQMSFSACSGQTGCSAPVLTNLQITAGSFTFTNVGPAGSFWEVDESSDLTNWAEIGGVTLDSSGNAGFTDNTINDVAYRFYKLTSGGCCSQAIGFTRIQVGAGTTNSPGTNALIANQLNAPSNTLDGLFNVNGSGQMPDGTPLPGGSVIFKYNIPTQAYVYYTWSGTEWLDGTGNNAGNVTLNPGEGAFLAVNNGIQVTFIGFVPEGSFSIAPLPGQFQLISSIIPKMGGLQTSLGFIPNRKDIIEAWNGSGFSSYQFVGSPGQWSPSQPIINVGQSFFWKGTTNSVAWPMSFSPCQ